MVGAEDIAGKAMSYSGSGYAQKVREWITTRALDNLKILSKNKS